MPRIFRAGKMPALRGAAAEPAKPVDVMQISATLQLASLAPKLKLRPLWMPRPLSEPIPSRSVRDRHDRRVLDLPLTSHGVVALAHRVDLPNYSHAVLQHDLLLGHCGARIHSRTVHAEDIHQRVVFELADD